MPAGRERGPVTNEFMNKSSYLDRRLRRGSSVVERCPEKAGVGSSILPLGTILKCRLTVLSDFRNKNISEFLELFLCVLRWCLFIEEIPYTRLGSECRRIRHDDKERFRHDILVFGEILYEFYIFARLDLEEVA